MLFKITCMSCSLLHRKKEKLKIKLMGENWRKICQLYWFQREMTGGSFCWVRWKIAQQEACIQVAVFKTNKQENPPKNALKQTPNKKTKPTNKNTDEDPLQNDTYMIYTNSRIAMKYPFHPKPHLNYSVGNNDYSWLPLITPFRHSPSSPAAPCFWERWQTHGQKED